VPEPTTLESPRYRLFCATWGSFSGESGLEDLTQTQANATALTTALTTLDALIDEPVLMHDTEGPACLTALDEFLVPDGDDVILYFASHGLVPSGANQFFRLATGDTRDVEDMMRAFVIAEVIDRLSRSGSGRRLVIIDACYAGKAASALVARGAVDLDLPDDICVLFSTDPFSVAKAPAGDSLTAFTGSLAEVLMRGLPDRGPRLSMRSIFSHLRASAEPLEIPQPWLVSTGTAAETITFRNAATGGDDAGTEFGERVAAFEHRTEILYVDDQEALRVRFRAELERAGHRVTLADGPDEAQQALTAGHFDIVVIDLLLVDDVPATEFIQAATRVAADSMLFLVSRRTKGSEDLWDRLDGIFAYPSRISAFLWKPDYARIIAQHAKRIQAARRHTLSRVDGLDEAVALVAERMIKRDAKLGDHSERLQLEVRVCVERLVEKWFRVDDEEDVYIERFSLRVVDGGRSSSVVFLLLPTLRGIEPESVSPLILKLGPRSELDEEVRRYDHYVQVGVPLDVRTDKIGSALVGGVGGIIYSFRGADDNSIREVAQLAPAEIEECLEALFGRGSRKRWYGSRGTGKGIPPLDHFKGLNFAAERFSTALRSLNASLQNSLSSLPKDSQLRGEAIAGAFESMTSSHQATLVHGDLTLENVIQINDSRFAIIDYRTVGLGPRLVDFATLEVSCWLLSRAPGSSRAERFLEARQAVPGRLRDDGDGSGVAEWLRSSWQLARRCRQLAAENHKDATDEEYGSLLWLAAVRCSEFRSRAVTTDERNAQRALLPAIALAAQAMINTTPA